PWQVYTTALGGGYAHDEGTSMAAPQAAGAAALILAKYPDMKPYEVRNMIRQSASPIGSSGWNEKAGYGMLRVDTALTNSYEPDFYEPNNQLNSAAVLPIGTMIAASLNSAQDQDWFQFTAPYTGEIEFRILADKAADLSKMKLVFRQ